MAPADVALPQTDSAFENFSEAVREWKQKVKESEFSRSTTSVAAVEHSGPQGKVKPLTIIDHPSDWTSASLKGKESEYTCRWREADTLELDAAVQKLKARGVSTEDDVQQLTREDYHLPVLSAKLVAVGKEVTHGRGFHLIRGFPVDIYRGDRLGLVLAFWGVALVLGRVQVSQTDYTEDGTTFGSVLNHVTVGRKTHVKVNPRHPRPAAGRSGVDGNSEGAKDFTTGKEGDKNREFLPFHSDQGATDLIALLSVTAAPKGGESKWVSSIAIHNELLRQGRKDLVEALSVKNSWFIPRKYDQATWERSPDGHYAGFEEIVPFEYHDGYLSVYFNNGNFHEINQELSPKQEEAIWAVAKLAEDPDFHFSLKLEPGDLELIHNPSTLHSRSDVYDGEAPYQKRHLLRWWVDSTANSRPIAPTFAPRSSVPANGGFHDYGEKVRLPFYPYSRHDGEGQSTY
ncbi:hypothetical protein WJX84_007599 [Apatococcus fuscideae]|uniref:TauD/TfdA-like domain-containing protein n=1 Tax=Apatococcus fuscideae TaxID=2026836 RepID=A0AAW1T5A2_9CHLO